MKDKGYAGKIQHSGVQKVEAPFNEKPKKGKASKTEGKDLRTGK